jgi:hypothetical protein
VITIKIFFAAASALLALTLGQRPAAAQTLSERPGQLVCAGNIPPDDMVITATGDSKYCGGSCRAREIKPVDGSIMIICAQQPIPQDYELQSVTTTAACGCIGEQDNAMVIRLRDDAPARRRHRSFDDDLVQEQGQRSGAFGAFGRSENAGPINGLNREVPR